MARRLGTAYVGIEADASLFRATAMAGMKKAIAGLEAEIPVNANTKKASAQILAFLAQLQLLHPEIDLHLNENQAIAAMEDLRARVGVIAQALDEMRANPDLAHDGLVQVARLQLAARNAAETLNKMRLNPRNLQQGELQVLNLESAFLRVADSIEKVTEAEREATAQAEFFHEKITPGLDYISKTLQGLKAGLDDKVFMSRIADMEAAVARFRTRKITLDEASMKSAEAELQRLLTRTEALGQGVENLNDRLVQGRLAWGGWFGGLLNARVALFAGARSVSGFHIALDSVVELLAIFVPALTVLTAGLGAFGAAAVLAQDTLGRIGDHMKYVNTVSQATGKTIPPLTDHFDKMASVIRPQVFQLLGDALGGAHNQLGIFDKLAEGTGAVLDRFAARIIVDMQGGQNGITKFVNTGTFMLQKLGIIAQNIGHVLAQLIRVAEQTGIAEKIVTVTAAFTGLLKVVADLPVPLLAIVAAFHGIYLWAGLATTALVKMVLSPVRGMLNLAVGANLAGKEVRSLTKDATGGERLRAYFNDISTAAQALPGRIKTIGKSIVTLFTNPWTWAVIGAAVIIGLGVAFITARDATDRFIDSMNKAVAAATVFNMINTTASALAQTNQKLRDTQKQLNDEFTKAAGSGNAAESRYASLGKAYGGTAHDAADLSDEQKKLTGELLLQSARVGEIAGLFGTKGLAGAMALAALAGVKVSDFLSKDPKVWATAIQQIQGLVDGYAAMGQGANQLASDLNALTVAGADQVKSIDQLNTAYDYFTKTVSAPVSGFLDFANTIKRFSQDAGVAGARMTGLGSGFTATSKKVTDASLQLQSDFQSTFTSAAQLFDAMRSSQAPAAVQTKAIKDAVQVLIPLAGTSKVAAAEISSLAQEAGGPATTNLKQLRDWAGKTHDPLAALQTDSNNAAIGFYNLSQDAQKLGTVLSQDLTADMAKAVENSVGLQAAMQKYTDDVQRGTQATAGGLADRKHLSDILVQLTGSQQSANAIIQAGTDKLQGNTKAIDQGGPARKNFQDHLDAILQKAPGAYGDINKFADAVKNHTDKTQAGQSARAQLVQDLKNSGLSAKEANTLVDGLQTSVDALHGKTIGITVDANGYVNVNGTKISAGAYFSPHAAGGFISGGTPGKDSVAAMLMPGEVVVPTSMVKQGAVDHLRGRLPGFAAGGQVGTPVTGNLKGNPAFPQEATNAITGFAAHSTATIAAAATKAFAQYVAQQKSAMAGGVGYAAGPAAYGSALAAQNYAKSILWAYGWTMAQWPPLLALWNQESGWNPYAVNPSSGAYGIPQSLGHGHPYNLGDYANQVRWGLAYISGRYGSPAAAWAHEVANNWYAAGGQVGGASARTPARVQRSDMFSPASDVKLVPGFAAGGKITGGSFGSQMASAQNREYTGYGRLRNAYTYDLAHAKAGSWTALHRAGITSELGTLKRYQANEQSAYNTTLSHSGSAASRSHLRSMLSLLLRVTKDIDLSHSHPALTHDLQHWIGVLTGLTGMTVTGPVPAKGAAAVPKLQFIPWLNQVKADQKNELGGYKGLLAALYSAMVHAKAGSWMYKNKKAVQERIYAVAKRQNDEVKYFNLLTSHATGSVADITALPGRIDSLNNVVSAELGNLQPALLGHSGAAPAQVRAFQGTLTKLQAMARSKPYSPPWDPGKLGPSHTATPQLLKFDRGGWLPPGLTLASNQTGRNERVGSPPTVNITIASSGSGDFDAFMLKWLKGNVRVHGGGDVQAAFGRH
jgi:hypothetical protein